MRSSFMLSSIITNSSRFLNLPLSAQALYMHLNRESDDMGIVDFVRVIRTVNANLGDQEALTKSGYIQLFSVQELILGYITDYTLNNPGLDVRYLKASQYWQYLLQSLPDAKVFARLYNPIPTKKEKKYKTIVITIKEWDSLPKEQSGNLAIKAVSSNYLSSTTQNPVGNPLESVPNTIEVNTSKNNSNEFNRHHLSHIPSSVDIAKIVQLVSDNIATVNDSAQLSSIKNYLQKLGKQQIIACIENCHNQHITTIPQLINVFKECEGECNDTAF